MMRRAEGRARRKMRAAGLMAVALALTLSAAPAQAWNNRGHMVVAAVAWQELTPRARQRVADLLKLHPEYARWVDGVPAAEQAEAAFLKAATWPDRIRNDPAYSRNEAKADAPLAAQSIGYADRLSHPSWHFRDAPIEVGGARGAPPEIPNAQTQIGAFRRALASRAPDALKSYDLVWLEHMVGDVHQPLHAVSRFTPEDTDGDRGGNDVKLCAEPCRENLHGLWDGALGRDDSLAGVRAAALSLPRAPDELARRSDEREWLRESEVIARNSAYAPPVGEGLGPYPVQEADRARVREIARGRVALAGRRLAALINRGLR